MRIPPKFLLIFIAVLAIEIFLFMKIGAAIGLAATLGITVVTTIVGAMLARSQGTRTLEKFQKTALAGKSARSEVFDGLSSMFAGALLVIPGFFTDFVGLLLLTPPGRKFVKARVTAAVGRHLNIQLQAFQSQNSPPPQPSAERRKIKVKKRRSRSGGKIIDAEIIDD